MRAKYSWIEMDAAVQEGLRSVIHYTTGETSELVAQIKAAMSLGQLLPVHIQNGVDVHDTSSHGDTTNTYLRRS